jgi:protein archease
MSYRWLDHTGEIALEVRAPDEEAVFDQAVVALGEVMAPEAPAHGGKEDMRAIEVEGRDRATLLAECLAEAIFLADTEDLVPAGLIDVQLEPRRLRGRLLGRRGRPTALVKAVTYHALRFERSGDGWLAHVVLDV